MALQRQHLLACETVVVVGLRGRRESIAVQGASRRERRVRKQQENNSNAMPMHARTHEKEIKAMAGRPLCFSLSLSPLSSFNFFFNKFKKKEKKVVFFSVPKNSILLMR